MSLADIAAAALDGWDAKKDSVDGNDELPAGNYTTVLSSATHASFKSGWDCFQAVFEVIEGEFVSRKVFNNISFATKAKNGKDISDFIINRSIKFVTKLAALSDITLTPQDFAFDNETDLHEHLAQLFIGKNGKTMTLKVSKQANKKNPSEPYTNYDLEELEQPDTTIDLDDEKMPFD